MADTKMEAIAERFRQSLAGGDLFTFMIGGTRQGVTGVGPAIGNDGPVLVVIGVPFEHLLRAVPEERRAKLAALPLLQIPTCFEGIPVEMHCDE
ncbi:MAG: hypothetical protein UY72_C0027G0008 [Candidatus Uhrbacteria bacterium GW2011_GWD2_52_7]|uniref:Uncharacterized protein n=1 Tax=Candidatus Uhrbacteria bacterium GW2011_GWD2_52_7 TaxID=1618989 RepID=A0A0G1ZPB7_9BACT|nr:MAG: hypothetical protein UY72_C0027G0008 [Candidatus Uhrbacteria bacterium GW2011_GWD2_52_7]